MIVDIDHIALQVPDLDASVEFACATLGMHEVERADGRAFLTLGSPYPSLGQLCAHHVLEYVEGEHAAFDHVGFLVRDAEALEELAAQAESAGATILPRGAEEPWIDRAVRLAAPTGQVFEFHTGMDTVNCDYQRSGFRPHRFGHATFLTTDLQGFMQFLVDGLGFSVSDWISTPEGPIVGFARCHFDHHTIAALASPADALHHIAFETPGAVEIGQLGDQLAGSGRSFVWGPARHGAGDNIAAYFADPDGVMIEIYADMHRIVGDAWAARSWMIDDPRALNTWGTAAGIEPLMAAELPLAAAQPSA